MLRPSRFGAGSPQSWCGRERRRWPRFVAADDPAEICWLRSKRRLGRASAVLLNVSSSGALVLADAIPGRPDLLLRLRWPVPSEWVRTRLVQARRTRIGPCLLHLAFAGRPSRHFLARAVDRTYRQN